MQREKKRIPHVGLSGRSIAWSGHLEKRKIKKVMAAWQKRKGN